MSHCNKHGLYHTKEGECPYCTIEELEEHNQNAQSLNGLLELRVEELLEENGRAVKLSLDQAKELIELKQERDALVEAARAVAESVREEGGSLAVVGAPEFRAMSAVLYDTNELSDAIDDMAKHLDKC